ncbi:MAG: hypothetical protein FJY74_06375 [Candidatus Eisenbacteria bacterium]|nr:hypothetical protein [Candidatus Eisenbacteria bacterium]
MKTRIQRSAPPDPAALRRLLSEQPDRVLDGARTVDADAQGPTGVDMVLVDAAGRPILVDVLEESPVAIPSRIFEHLDWLEQTRRLFLRAYSRDGVVKAEEPVLVFVAPSFPSAVQRAVSACQEVEVRLIRIETFLIDGAVEVSCEEVVAPQARRLAQATVRRTAEIAQGTEQGFGARIESNTVRALFALFKSGVDGLDGRIAAKESNGGLVFELGSHALAHVSASPGSFTVSAGEPMSNPIVVSDRVSLERALNAVVSSFVREGRGDGDDGNGRAADLDAKTTSELARIWGGGVGRSERG